MQTTLEETPVMQKTRELCQTILDQPTMQSIRQRIDAFMGNAREFMDAQEELHELQQSVQTYVNKTLELGRLPTESELSHGSCGHGCGCGHGH